MKKKLSTLFVSLSLILGSVTFNLYKNNEAQFTPVSAADYYASITDSMSGSTLLSNLKSIINNNSVSVSYDWSRYEDADEDPNNSSNVILVYARNSVAKTAHVSGNTGWNREHTFPASKLSNTQAEKDNHIIFASDNKVNGARSNIKMGVVSGGTVVNDYFGNATTCRKTTSLFDPNNVARGIVARSTMYAAAMYEYDPTDNFESIATMLRWHLEYPVSSFDEGRNEKVYTNQHNRNPFVDHPEYACRIWGNTNSTTQSICNTSTTGITSISQTSLSLTVDAISTLSAVSSNSQTISWSSSNTNVATVSSSTAASGANITVTAVGEGTAVITAGITINSTLYTKTCTVTVSSSGGSGGGGGQEEQEEGDYTLVTSNSSLSNGDKVVLTTLQSENNIRGVTGWNNNKDATISTTSSEWKQFTVGSASSSGWSLQDGSSYIASPSGNEFKYSSSAGTCSADSTGKLVCNSRYLCINGTSYRFYTAVGSYTPFYVYKVTTSSGSSEPTLSSISVSTAPTKTTYTAGEYFDPTGLVIARTYSDSSSDTYTYANHTSDFTFNPTTSTALTTSNVSVTITYGGKSCSQPITVNTQAKTLSSIAVSTAPTKTTYTAGEYFDPTGLVITRSYSDSTSDTYTYANHTSEFTFNPSISTALTTDYTSVTITYNNKSTTQSITVNSSGGGGQNESFSTSYTYDKVGITWSLTNYTSPSGYVLCPDTNNSTSVALIEGIFDNKEITSSVVVTINCATYGSGTNPSSTTFAIYNSSACTSLVASSQGGTLPTSSTYTDVTYTVTQSNAVSSFTDDLAILITKPGKQMRIKSITVEFDYNTSGSSQQTDPTSITATVSKTYYVGETIAKSDITVKDNLNRTVSASNFTFANEGYQFTYSDAASGGASTSKTFTNSITYSAYSLTCSLTVQVQRKAYATPATSSLTHTGAEFSTAGIGSSYATNQSATVDGITFRVDGYIYSSKLSLSESKTSAPGLVQNITPYSTGITNVSVSGATPDIQLSVNGTSWVDLSSATTSTVNYFYLKIFYKTTSQSNYVNITQIDVTLKGAETAMSLSNYVMYEDTANQCTTKLNTAITYLGDMSSSERTTFQTSNDYVISTARERLEAWARNQGKTINYSTGALSSSINVFGVGIKENSEAVTIVIIIAITSICSFAGFLYLRKRKKQ